MSRTAAAESTFKLLGVLFDEKLHMTQAVTDLTRKATWKITTLLKVNNIIAGVIFPL